jgi:hypothetical protein
MIEDLLSPVASTATNMIRIAVNTVPIS